MTLPADDMIQRAQSLFAQAIDAAALENAKATFLGKQGEITALMKGLATLPPEEKRTQGAAINQIKRQIETLLNDHRDALAQAELNQRLASEAIDVTLPGRGRTVGGIHPVIRT